MLVAGEESGDARAAELVRSLQKKHPDVTLFGIGGDRLAGLGVELIYHMKDMAFLGFGEVVRHLPFIMKVFRRLTEEMKIRKPDLVLLVDYPGFNLRLAGKAKQLGFPVVYYISPQVWAWGGGRVKKMARNIDRMLVVFPFEEKLYHKHGLDTRFVGHPLKDSPPPSMTRDEFFQRLGFDPDRPLVGLLPGSRRQEIERLLPRMTEAFHLVHTELKGKVQAALGQAPAIPESVYQEHVRKNTELITYTVHTRELMAYADVILVASGTATLETALFQTPMIICYRMAPVSYLIGRVLVRVPYIGLANIVAGRSVVPELIQGQASTRLMAQNLYDLLTRPEKREKMRKDLALVSSRLGQPGAAERAADAVLEVAKRS